MTLDDFLIKHRITLSSSVHYTAAIGLQLMANSVDPLHTLDHILRMFDDLDLMIAQLTEIDWSKINFEVLLLSVIWHDTYKSQHLARSKRRMFFDHVLVDGLGSMRLFTRYARKSGLPDGVLKQVRYAIRKHSMFQVLPRRTSEAKLLKYLDEFEDWSFARFDYAFSQVRSLADVAPRLFPIVRFYFRHWMLRKNSSSKYPKWVRYEYLKRKNRFVRLTGDNISAALHGAPSKTHSIPEQSSTPQQTESR